MVQPGDKVKWSKYLLAGDGSGVRVQKDYEGIVEKVECNEISEYYYAYVSMNEFGGQIVSASDLEIIEKDVAKLEGNQTVLDFEEV